MQKYAFDINKTITPAKLALEKLNYFCPECKETVVLKKTHNKGSYFFHLEKNHCRHSKKSLQDLEIHNKIASLFSNREVIIEKYFKNIERIADLCWQKENIIFEVQCSYITSDEILQRNLEYKKMGYKVIWILHEKIFLRPHVTKAEKILSSTPHYFTNINEDQNGIIYELFFINSKQRHLNPIKFPININKLVTLSYKSLIKASLPTITFTKHSAYSFCFQGDSCYQKISKKASIQKLELIKKSELKYLKKTMLFSKNDFFSIFSDIKNLYFSIFYKILQNCSKK